MDWHLRYLQQASWTGELRQYLMKNVGLGKARSLLEVGCGTGAVLEDLLRLSDENQNQRVVLHGLDLSAAALSSARTHAPAAVLTCGDAQSLPFVAGSFDITVCHFLLLWVSDPLAAISEMGRVTIKDGHVIALAEPDHSARIDFPKELAILGRLQFESLLAQGADPVIGARLATLFDQAGLRIVETGSISASGTGPLSDEAWQLEWDVLRSDLAGRISSNRLDRLMQEDLAARRLGQRVLHVPTYFVHAQV